MSPVDRRIALGVAIAVLVAGGYGLYALNSARDPDSRPGTSLGLPDAGEGPTPPGSGSSASAEASRTPGSSVPARDGDQVPDDAAYDIIDALRDAGKVPAMGSDLTLEYVGMLDTVKVTGTFEGGGQKTYTLEYRDGAWKVAQ